jgi:predicted TIM-barrel fold metal-dependent hydrolase
MRIDCHVHISACVPEHGFMSDKLLRSLPFRMMRWKLGVAGNDAQTERDLEAALVRAVNDTPELDAVAVLAFDRAYRNDGHPDYSNTHFYLSNDYAMELSRRHEKLLFAASIHPYRRDAVKELERCVAGGAVLVKWLPIVQNIDPTDLRCFPFYEALAHLGIPLLSHTGSEHALPCLNKAVASPSLLSPALRRGVKVIMAHCGSRLLPWEVDYTPTFMRMAHDYEHCYGDTAALNVPNRWYAMSAVMADPVVRSKLVHGSDWPVPVMPSPSRLGWDLASSLVFEKNWLRRDVRIKQELGLDAAYWNRAGEVLRLNGSQRAVAGSH